MNFKMSSLIKVMKAQVENNRVVCPKCNTKDEFASAYDYNKFESDEGNFVQFFVRCIHKEEDNECNCCSTYLVDMSTGTRYSLDQI